MQKMPLLEQYLTKNIKMSKQTESGDALLTPAYLHEWNNNVIIWL